MEGETQAARLFFFPVAAALLSTSPSLSPSAPQHSLSPFPSRSRSTPSNPPSTDNDGKLTGADAVAFFERSGLPRPALAKVWTLADAGRRGFLDRRSFAKAMELIGIAQRSPHGGDDLSAEAYAEAAARADLDPPLRDWLAWLMNLAPQQRPQSVAQALDMLMLSMQTGFTYMPQQAPAMAPGFQTTPLVAAVPTPAPVTATSSAPKPKPIQPKSAPAAAASVSPPAAAPKKTSSSRVLAAVVLNLAALAVIGVFLWPIIQKSLPRVEVSTAVSSDKPTAVATPITTADITKVNAPAPARPAPPPAVTEADAKGR